jgi:hypothetical protein
MRLIGMMGILLILVGAGCVIGSDSRAVAKELRALRETHVQNGLLAPTAENDRVLYENELRAFRVRIRQSGGLDGGTLNEYIDGSLALIEMYRALESGNSALETASETVTDCGKGTPLVVSLEKFQTAKEKSQEAHTAFERVRENISISNEVGVDYLENALITTTGQTTMEYALQIDALKTACGTPL